MKKVLFGTTALAGVLALATTASAGEIKLPGALDLTIDGTSDFEVEWADGDFGFGRNVNEQPQPVFNNEGELIGTTETDPREEGGDNRELFFNQDHEIRFIARGIGDATGIRYGARLDLELQTGDANTGVNADWDEAWIWFGNGWGEFRLGNVDGPSDNLNIGGFSNNRGTGGLDGAQRTVGNPKIADSAEATKILYYTPNVAGFQAGVSYAINSGDRGSSLGTTNDDEDVYEVAANWQGALGPVDAGIFGGYVGGTSNVPNKTISNWQVGGEVGFAGFSLAGAYGDETSEATGRSGFWNVGVGGEFAGVGMSFGFQNDGVKNAKDQQQYVVSADTAILPGVALRGDVAYVNRFAGNEESGVNAVVQLRVAF